MLFLVIVNFLATRFWENICTLGIRKLWFGTFTCSRFGQPIPELTSKETCENNFAISPLTMFLVFKLNFLDEVKTNWVTNKILFLIVATNSRKTRFCVTSRLKQQFLELSTKPNLINLTSTADNSNVNSQKQQIILKLRKLSS
jgi:hypothetical protein